MMYLIKTTIAIFCILLFGCQATTSVAKQDIKPEFLYQPQGHQEFIFTSLPKAQQKQGYRNICFAPPQHKINCSLNKLRYRRYLGKRGYYTSTAPIPYIYLVYEQRKGDLAYEAILETGERIYILKSQRDPFLGQFISPYSNKSHTLMQEQQHAP